MSLSLHYFDGRGVIEPTRIMLNMKKIDFEDVRYPIDMATYSRPEFDAVKATGKFAANMDRVPVLIVGDAVIGQSKAIDRYVAKTCGMYGSNDIDAAMIDMIGEHVRDIKDAYQKIKVGKTGDELTAATTEFVNATLPDWLSKLEKTRSGSNFAVGNSLSLADVYIFSFLTEYFDLKWEVITLAAKYPKLSQSVAAVQEGASAYLSERKVTKF